MAISPARGETWVVTGYPGFSESRRDETWVFCLEGYPHFVPTGLWEGLLQLFSTHITPLAGLLPLRNALPTTGATNLLSVWPKTWKAFRAPTSNTASGFIFFTKCQLVNGLLANYLPEYASKLNFHLPAVDSLVKSETDQPVIIECHQPRSSSNTNKMNDLKVLDLIRTFMLPSRAMGQIIC